MGIEGVTQHPSMELSCPSWSHIGYIHNGVRESLFRVKLEIGRAGHHHPYLPLLLIKADTIKGAAIHIEGTTCSITFS